jgi:hypothetical protein
VQGTQLYGPTPSAGDLVSFGDAQTAALEKANGRTIDSIAIVEKCEARDRRAMEKLARPWWRFWIDRLAPASSDSGRDQR